MDRAFSAHCSRSRSTSSTTSIETLTLALKPRPKMRRRTASSTRWRRAVTQTPRPGSRRLTSGTTAPSGATTKRMSSPTGRTSRVATHHRSVAAAAARAPRSVTAFFVRLCMGLRHQTHLGRLLGGRFGLLRRELGGQLGLGNPTSLDAGLHDDELAFLARELEAFEKSGVARDFAVLALGPAGEVVGG